jgi:clan AA aspartic protease
MGRTYDELTVKNGYDLALFHRGYSKEGDVRQEKVRFLVDTGSDEVYLPEEYEKKLGLMEMRGKRITIGGGKQVLCKVASPVEICWQDRATTLNPIIMEGQDTPILGLLALEGLALKVDPTGQRLEPAYPDGVMGQLL